MFCGPIVDPSSLWDSRKWKSQLPGQVREQTTATPVHLHLPGSQNPAPKESKMPVEKDHWRLQPVFVPNQSSGKTWADHYIQDVNRKLLRMSAPEANWHHGLCTLWLQRSGTDGPPHPPGLFHLAVTETTVMAAGWVNHQQAVGNSGRPLPHHPNPGNMWTEGLGMADWQQKSFIKRQLSKGNVFIMLFLTSYYLTP